MALIGSVFAIDYERRNDQGWTCGTINDFGRFPEIFLILIRSERNILALQMIIGEHFYRDFTIGNRVLGNAGVDIAILNTLNSNGLAVNCHENDVAFFANFLPEAFLLKRGCNAAGRGVTWC